VCNIVEGLQLQLMYATSISTHSKHSGNYLVFQHRPEPEMALVHQKWEIHFVGVFYEIISYQVPPSHQL